MQLGSRLRRRLVAAKFSMLEIVCGDYAMCTSRKRKSEGANALVRLPSRNVKNAVPLGDKPLT
jgi:hypothetical protein